MDWQQKVIAEEYKGDIAHFEADYAEDVQAGRLHAVDWNDVLVEATTLTDLKEDARDLIWQYLGYLPLDTTILPFEPYLRALIHSHQQNQMSQEAYRHQVEEHIKLIRNKDMESTYNTYIPKDKLAYQNYEKTFLPFGPMVKNRLMIFLGYEPKLEHSAVAEMWMRHMLSTDTIPLPDTITDLDQKAIAMTKYREVLLEKGQAAADGSPLVRFNEKAYGGLSH